MILKKTPRQLGIKLYKNNKIIENKIIAQYQSEIGLLLYLLLKTRPDITFNLNLEARFIANPVKDHFNLTKYI